MYTQRQLLHPYLSEPSFEIDETLDSHLFILNITCSGHEIPFLFPVSEDISFYFQTWFFLGDAGGKEPACQCRRCMHACVFCCCPVVSYSLQPHGFQHTLSPCPSSSPGVCPSLCSLHQWCHPATSSSDALFSFWPQSFSASGTFPMGHLFASDDQNTGTSISTSVLPVNIQGWFLKIDWFDLLAIQGTFRSLLRHHSSKTSILWCSTFFTIHLSQL